MSLLKIPIELIPQMAGRLDTPEAVFNFSLT